MLAFVVLVILIALLFDYVNGMHDAANSIATVVSTRVLTPTQAVAMAAFFNAVAIILGTHVAAAVGKGVIKPEKVTEVVIFCGLVGAIFWNVLTWWLGLPSSSSHALIGGLAGAGLAAGGNDVLVWTADPGKPSILRTCEFIVLAPLAGFVLALAITIACTWLFRHFSASKVDKLFRRLQLLSAAAYSFGHGSNDAQKTMGIIAMVLYRYQMRSDPSAEFHVPLWVAFSCHFFIGLGTLAGGWRIVKTMGSKICKLKPFGGFCAEGAGAITLLATAMAGIPVSTTHTITGAIIGVGSTMRLSAVRWGVAYNIVIAWVLTIPAAAAVSYVTYAVTRPLATLLGIP